MDIAKEWNRSEIVKLIKEFDTGNYNSQIRIINIKIKIKNNRTKIFRIFRNISRFSSY